MNSIVLPASLVRRQTPAGFHHLGLKALFYGGPKSGKSFALASFPSPVFAISCGEDGIALYLHPERGDVSVFVDDAKSYTEALEFALGNPKIASVVIDGVNLVFDDWMASFEDSLGVAEIKGGNWRKVKAPWKVLHRKVMQSTKNFGFSAWPRGAKYVEEVEPSTMPGIEGKKSLRILEQDAPHVEKMLPFALDMTLKTEIEFDKKFAPTSIHRITYMGGRRPASIPADELYAGKNWRFDAKKIGEQSPFDKVLKPIIEKWGIGATEYVNLDPEEGEREIGEAKTIYEDQEVGRILASLRACKSFEELKRVWLEAEATVNKDLPPFKHALVVEEKERKKKELTRG